jgi:hypothetical protein
MKRLTLLAAALIMVMGMAVSASAAPEVTISGNLLVNAVWQDNWDFGDDTAGNNDPENMTIMERADLYFTVTANENLKGVLGLRSDRGEWGKQPLTDADGFGGAGAAQLNIRDAYLDFMWPDTSVNVKAGFFTVGLPQQVGGASWVYSDRSGAVLVSAPMTDNVSVLAGYTRLFDGNNTGADHQDQTQIDAWLAALPMTFEGWSMSPYVLYAPYGDNYGDAIVGADGDITQYWIGTDWSVSMLDPFILKGDIIYGKTDTDINGAEQSGWMFDLGLEYKGFDFMNTEAYFVYASGEDDDNSESESMPVLSDDWAVGSFFFGGGSITGDDIGNATAGLWILGVSLTDIQSFTEGLTHDVHALYVGGLNDEDAAGLNYGRDLKENDSLVELDFNTAYKIYDELTLYNQIGYMHLDAKEDDWAADQDGGDAFKFAMGVVYQF